jgi:hypothetical protein
MRVLFAAGQAFIGNIVIWNLLAILSFENHWQYCHLVLIPCFYAWLDYCHSIGMDCHTLAKLKNLGNWLVAWV